MTSLRSRIGPLLLVAVACASAPGHAAAQSPEASELATLAREAIEAQNDVLVSGNAEAALQRRERAAQFRDGIRERVSINVNRKRVLSQRGNDYRSHRTQVRVDSTVVQGEQATVTALEHVVLTLDPAIGGPGETEYELLHVMRFAREGGTWRMVSDVTPQAPPLPEDTRGPTAGPPMADAPQGYQPRSRAERGRAGGGTASLLERPSLFRFASLTGGAERGVAYNPNAAVNYALTYVFNYNPAYRVYAENDCTNFTSQALRAGGWPFDETGTRTEPDTWYYGNYTWTTSYSWAAAHNFNLFFKQSGRGMAAQYFSDLLTGDLVQADWGPTPDGNISHSMIVTALDVNNRAYLTYHSTNTKNRSLDDLAAANPGTRWFGLLLYL